MLLSDKPNRTGILNVDAEHEATLGNELKDKLMRLSAVPKTKTSFPVTSNQEFGWDSDLVSFT